MRLFSWNVNGLYNTLKDAGHRYRSVSNYFSEVLAADILCFQEAKIQEEKLEKWMACVPGYESFWAFCSVKKGYSGVVTYVKEDFSPLDAKADYLGDLDTDTDEDLCKEGRLMETDHGSFVLINVYVPNAGEREEGRPRLNFKLRFLKALKNRCDDIVRLGKEIIVLGDFNIAHRDIDVFKNWNIHEIYTQEEISWIDEFFRDYVDMFRYFHPDARDVFSVWNAKTEARIHNEGLRIDYAVCSKGFLDQVIDAQIVKMVPKSWSDHAAIVVTLKEQPVLPVHPISALSSQSMKRFKEDHRQKKLTALFGGRLLKSIPSNQLELTSNENQECQLLNRSKSTWRKDIHLPKGHGGNSNEPSNKSIKDNPDVNNSDGSKGRDPSHLSNKHLGVDLNTDNAQFDQKHKTESNDVFQKAVFFDANEMMMTENENDQLRESQQQGTTDCMTSSVDCTSSALTRRTSEEMNVNPNKLVETCVSTECNAYNKTLRDPFSSTQQKFKGSKKHKRTVENVSGHAGKQKGLEFYFKMQNS